MQRRNILIGLGVLTLTTILIIWYWQAKRTPEVVVPFDPKPVAIEAPTSSVATIGYSGEGRPITAFTYGTGTNTLLFVGGIHGGYEWNSTLLAYETIDALENGTLVVPSSLTVIIVPSLNPDGSFRITGSSGRFDPLAVKAASFPGEGRFAASDVDLNRNFDCKWQPTSTWRSAPVSAGSAPFSESEAAAFRDFVLATKPAGVIMWHSQGGAVYGSECEEGILATTTRMMNTYATASGYTPIEKFDAYPISGDAEGWLAKIGIPAITVELATRTSSEWERNQKSLEALFLLFSN